MTYDIRINHKQRDRIVRALELLDISEPVSNDPEDFDLLVLADMFVNIEANTINGLCL